MFQHSFEWNGATITVKAPDGFGRSKQWKLNRYALQIEDDVLQDFAGEVSLYLANTVSVDGDIGFPVPNGNVTYDSFVAFCEGLGNADSALLAQWDNALYEAMQARNDPDLMPPVAPGEKKDEPPQS